MHAVDGGSHCLLFPDDVPESYRVLGHDWVTIISKVTTIERELNYCPGHAET